MIKLSVITSIVPSVAAKSITRRADGSLQKDAARGMTKGQASHVELADLYQFNGLLDSLAPCHALAFGAPSAPQSQIVKAADLPTTPGAISRSDKYFAWPQGEGILFLDYDPAPGETTMQPQALLDALSSVIGPCGKLWRPSASGFIYDSATGAELDGLKGQHVYVTVADATDIPRAGAVLFKRLWLKGHGSIVVAQNGAQLVRSLVDGAVWQPSRLDFAAGAVCGPGIVRNPPAGVVLDGPVLDTRTALPDLTDAEEQAYLLAVSTAKAQGATASANVREQYIAQRAEVEGVTVEAVRARYEMAEEMQVLCGDFPIEFANGDVFSVAHIMANPDTFNGKICLDPIEPEYNNRHPVGKLYLDSRGTSLDSKAHGGRVFYLGIDTGEAFKASANGGQTFKDKLNAIRKSGGELDDLAETIESIDTGPFSESQRTILKSEVEGQSKENGRLLPQIKALIWGNDATPQASSSTPSVAGVYSKEDGHNATLFMSRCYPGGVRVYDEEWYVYTGAGWRKVPPAQIKSEMTVDMIYSHGVQQSHVDNAYRTALNVCGVYTGPAVNETPEHLVLFRNGVLNTLTGELSPHTPDIFCTNVLPYDFDINATAPNWVAWLNNIFDGDQERVQLLQEWIGYLMVRTYDHQKLMLFIGPPRAGKGVIAAIIKLVVGEGNALGTNLLGLLKDSVLDSMRDKPVAIIGEVENSALGRHQGEIVERLKMISGGDAISWDRKYRSATSAKLPSRFTILSNHTPKLFDDSGALAARAMILPFFKSFTGAAEDTGVLARVSRDVQGIAVWALQGLARLRNTGAFTVSSLGAFEAESIEENTNPMRTFIRECITLGGTDIVQVGTLYDAHCAWSVSKREDVLKPRTFSSSFKSSIAGLGRHYGNHRDGSGVQGKGYKGIVLTTTGIPNNVTQGAFGAGKEQTI